MRGIHTRHHTSTSANRLSDDDWRMGSTPSTPAPAAAAAAPAPPTLPPAAPVADTPLDGGGGMPAGTAAAAAGGSGSDAGGVGGGDGEGRYRHPGAHHVHRHPTYHEHGRRHAGKRHKGVTYTADGSVDACIFCRIVGGQERNPVWYRDDVVTVFVPRSPAAVLHLLVVPNHHLPTIAQCASHDDVALLQHMGRVAREQLAAHAPHFDLTARRLGRMALPPTHYTFPRGGIVPAPDDASAGAPAPATAPAPAPAAAAHKVEDANMMLLFHRPPFNSIDHLHLHALYTPFASLTDRMHFLLASPWVVPLQSVIDTTRSRAAAAGSAAPASGGAGSGGAGSGSGGALS